MKPIKSSSGKTTVDRKSHAGKACGSKYHLILFLAGDEPNSRAARAKLETFFEQGILSREEVEIVDVLQDFETAVKYNVLVTPMLLVLKPSPTVTIVGNLSDTGRLHQILHGRREQVDG